MINILLEILLQVLFPDSVNQAQAQILCEELEQDSKDVR